MGSIGTSPTAFGCAPPRVPSEGFPLCSCVAFGIAVVRIAGVGDLRMATGVVFRAPLAGLVMLLLAGGAGAAESVIVVTGTGSAEMQPDRVTIEFTVLDRARTAAEASEGNARQTQPILTALRALGVPDTAVTSAGFAVQPPWDPRRGTRKENESVATHRLRVRVSEIRTAGAIVETLLDSGADRIEIVSFSVSRTDSAREAALSQAVEQARGDAEVMARAAGGSLGPCIEVTTQGTAAPPRAHEVRAMSLVASPSIPPSITPGPTLISVTVLGRWMFVERK